MTLSLKALASKMDDMFTQAEALIEETNVASRALLTKAGKSVKELQKPTREEMGNSGCIEHSSNTMHVVTKDGVEEKTERSVEKCKHDGETGALRDPQADAA